MQTLDQWLFSFVRHSARKQEARQQESKITFRLCWQIRIVVILVFIGVGSSLVLLFFAPWSADDPWYSKPLFMSIVGALPASILFALPGHVVTDFTGIRQRYWWRFERRLEWTDVVSVERTAQDETIVYGKFSRPIVFSPYLGARARFESEVKTHSRRTDPASDF